MLSNVMDNMYNICIMLAIWLAVQYWKPSISKRATCNRSISEAHMHFQHINNNYTYLCDKYFVCKSCRYLLHDYKTMLTLFIQVRIWYMYIISFWIGYRFYVKEMYYDETLTLCLLFEFMSKIKGLPYS